MKRLVTIFIINERLEDKKERRRRELIWNQVGKEKVVEVKERIKQNPEARIQ